MSTTTASKSASPPSRSAGRSVWAVTAGIVGALVLGLIGGLWIGRATAPAPVAITGDEVSATAAQMLTDRVVAINAADPVAISAFYSADAVLEEHDQDPPRVTTTADEIGHHLAGYATMGFRITQPGGFVAVGPYIGEPLRWSEGDGGISVYRLDENGLIAHQWVIGGSVTEATTTQ